MIGASLAYGLWDQLTWFPEDVRLVLAAVLVIIGIVCALLQPGGRSLDQWLVAWLLVAAPGHMRSGGVGRTGAPPGVAMVSAAMQERLDLLALERGVASFGTRSPTHAVALLDRRA